MNMRREWRKYLESEIRVLLNENDHSTVREREGGEEEEEGESERETRIGRDCGGERKLKREKVE